MSLRYRRGTWYARLKLRLPDGTLYGPHEFKAGQTQRQARIFESKWRESVLDGSYFRKKVAPPLLKDFWTEYKSWLDANTKPAHAKAVEVAWRIHVLPCFGGLRLDEVRKPELEKLKAEMLKADYAPHTINNVLGYLHRGLTLAIEYGKLEKAPGVGLLAYDKEEAEWLEPEEQRRFLRACDYWPERRALLAFLLETGLRIGECLALRTRDIDFARNVLVVRRTRVATDGSFGRPKGGTSREVHLSGAAASALKSIRGLGELAFTSRTGKPLTHDMVRGWVNQAAQRAGIAKHLSAHSLRHTRTANMVMAGVDERTIMAELGWTTATMLRRYSHLSPLHRREAVAKVEAFLSGAQKKTEES